MNWFNKIGYRSGDIAGNVVCASLTALITKNTSERVQPGSIRFIFAFATSLLIQYITLDVVQYFGGGGEGWKIVAIICAIIGLATNSFSGLSVKELPPEELDETDGKDLQEQEDRYTLLDAGRLLFSNKYCLMICATYLTTQLYASTLNMGVYFMKYILGDETLLSTFSLYINIPLIAGLLVTPWLVKKMGGMNKRNILGYAIAVIGRALVIAAGYMQNIPSMLIFTGVSALGSSPLQDDLNALIPSCSEYTFLTSRGLCGKYRRPVRRHHRYAAHHVPVAAHDLQYSGHLHSDQAERGRANADLLVEKA